MPQLCTAFFPSLLSSFKFSQAFSEEVLRLHSRARHAVDADDEEGALLSFALLSEPWRSEGGSERCSPQFQGSGAGSRFVSKSK